MYDASPSTMQTEQTEYCSNSLYGMGKIAENSLVRYYRNRGLFACTAILYNHESHRRSSDFVTKKIVENMVKVKREEIKQFTLGSLDAEKDWGYAGDYTEAMYLMQQNDIPKDYILATGKMHTISDFLEVCAEILELGDWKQYVVVDQRIVKRKIAGRLQGNSTLIEKELHWERKINFHKLVSEMIEYELGDNNVGLE